MIPWLPVHAECRTAHFISSDRNDVIPIPVQQNVEQTVIVDKAIKPPTVYDGT